MGTCRGITLLVGASGGLLEGFTHLLDEAGDVGQLGPSVAGLLVEGLVEQAVACGPGLTRAAAGAGGSHPRLVLVGPVAEAL